MVLYELLTNNLQTLYNCCKIMASILDDELEDRFEKSINFLLHKWSMMDALYTLGYNQVDGQFKPITEKVQPGTLCYSTSPSGIYMGTVEDGFHILSFDQFMVYNRLRREYVNSRHRR